MIIVLMGVSGSGKSTLAKLLQTVDDQLLHPDENDFVGRQYVRDEIAS